MEDNLPIDIHYNKLLDWLQSRRHCSSNWQQEATVIREKINQAIQDMPPVDEITQLLRGTYINYFHCLKIVELLKQTEDGSKNIFGQYSSKRLKDWLEIVKLYEKDGVYLAEVGQMLSRNVNYEIPVLKKLISKSNQSQQEYARKEVEYLRTSEDLQEKFKVSCRRMEIEGKNIKKEFYEMVKMLPKMFHEIAFDCQMLKPCIEYYIGFVAFLHNQKNTEIDCLPLLRHIIEKGNTTVYEWQTGHPPKQIVETPFNVELSDGEDEKEEKENEIDWGASVLDSTKDIEITTTGANVITEDQDLIDTEIDWEVVDPLTSGIEIEVISEDNSQNSQDGDVAQESVASGCDAFSVLDNVATRNLFIDELYELETFFEQRCRELTGTGFDVFSDTVLQSAPNSLHLNGEKVAAMLDNVRKILGHVTSQKMIDLFLIRNFPRYVDRLVENLKSITCESEKMKSMSRLMILRREEAEEERRQMEPTLELMRQRTKELQKKIEAEISAKYKNRPVNIMGEINTI